MAQRVTESFINSVIPGAYPNTSVVSQPVGVGASGIMVIIGEADGGDNYANTNIKNNFYGPDQLNAVAKKYLSGPIVDAMAMLASPSADPDIKGSASAVYILKTNLSARASAAVDTDYGTFKDLNLGVNGNKYKFTITQLLAESAPTVTGTAIGSFGAALNGASFTIRLNGGAATVVTLSGTSGNHASASTLATELNALLPAGIVASAGGVSGTIVLTVAADATANRKGWGKSFELIDSTPGNLASLGLNAGLVVSAAEPAVELQTVRADIGVNEVLDINSAVAMQIGYAGTSATLSLSQSTHLLTTTVVGGTGTSLSIDLRNYATINDLATYIASQPGYTCSAVAQAQSASPATLDTVSTIGICSPAGKPGRIKNAAATFQAKLATSTALSFTATATAGLPGAVAATYLSGGTRGSTSSADIVNALALLAGIQANIIVPLFSQDATADIAIGVTDSGSSYTIDALNLAVKNHCLQYGTPKMKRNRIAVLSNMDTYVNAKARAQALATFRAGFCFQQVVQNNAQGALTTFQPWMASVVAGGMQLGGFYKSITNKLANVVSIIDPAGFDSGSPTSVEDGLMAGMLILQNQTSGIAWVSDQTTYGIDTNFVYNSLQAVYNADLIALDLAASFQSAFVGQSLADVNAATALGFLSQKMDAYRKQKLIAASSDAPLGYKNPRISITAPTMDVAVEIKLATAIYFIPLSINISQISQSAG